MHLPQSLAGHMRINLRGADAGMAEQLLDNAQVRAMFQQVRREAVAQHMRCHRAANARPAHSLLNAQPECYRREWRAAFGKKNARG